MGKVLRIPSKKHAHDARPLELAHDARPLELSHAHPWELADQARLCSPIGAHPTARTSAPWSNASPITVTFDSFLQTGPIIYQIKALDEPYKTHHLWL
ncbi:unnamed protein product [Ilex paraguariensis]|uniref:Uncharacterized protein n=1 Tax=Ilex paraguariensis TaxID=185542 RepID=A0ABC8RH91_9AQUA